MGQDKMLLSAQEKGETVWEIADFYTKAFFKDTALLNIKRPTTACKATDHIEDMINLIKRIEKNGYTYFKGGNLYFNISKKHDYGKLANLDTKALKAGARIEIDKNKQNPHDFVLWFTKSKFKRQIMMWDSPWGNGYPGWHIECSAMSMRYLGDNFDIHCGGVDHISVHHTNEIAQAEAATEKNWVNFWIHGEFLVIAKDKMSKSLGNFLTLSSLTQKGYNPLDYRYLCLQAHYRSQLQFSLEALEASRRARNNLVEKIAYLKKECGSKISNSIQGKAKQYYNSFIENAVNDLNMPRCLSDLWNLIKDQEIDSYLKLKTALEMDKVLGLKLKEAKAEEVKLDEKLKMLIQERNKARSQKDFKRADEIRKMLALRGIILEDTKQGVRLKKNKFFVTNSI